MNIVKKSRAFTAAKPAKGSHKMSAEGIELILSMWVGGASNKEIQEALLQRYGIALHINMLAYYRRKYADELRRRYQDEYEEARVAYPGLETLAERLGALHRLIGTEFARGDAASCALVAKAVSLAGTMVYRAELRTLAEREARYMKENDYTRERLLMELEPAAPAEGDSDNRRGARVLDESFLEVE